MIATNNVLSSVEQKFVKSRRPVCPVPKSSRIRRLQQLCFLKHDRLWRLRPDICIVPPHPRAQVQLLPVHFIGVDCVDYYARELYDLHRASYPYYITVLRNLSPRLSSCRHILYPDRTRVR